MESHALAHTACVVCQVLDASLLRPGRFDRCIYVGPPDQPQRHVRLPTSVLSF
jgi:ATP-dependent 26S proteasome regulatory subunit